MEPKQFQHHPLLVMNNFSGEGMQLKLMSTMFQNMFPSINVTKVGFLSPVRQTRWEQQHMRYTNTCRFIFIE